ncbi:MAG: hypothetical protein H6Q90_2996 [Deltaproteobacteria bacterium]|nr:hypothetical protein [Deltaproteobacteria bacterium]
MVVVAGLLTSLLAGSATADVTFTFTTTPNGGEFAPNNVVAGWIEVDQGPFVKTIGVYAAERKINLIAWGLIAGPNDVDAISGATRLDHLTPVTMTWNLRDKAGNLVPDGAYRLRLEMADSNAITTADNRQGAFTFLKSSTPQLQTGLSSGGFTDATVDFAPVLCSNGVVDPGEACDSAISGSCPTACPVSDNACMSSSLVGDAVTCTAACSVQAITACISDDGCCAPGCTAADDNDCEGVDQGNIAGGCDAGGGAGLAFAAFGLGVLLAGRRRVVQ